jgi:GxxExxY protein
MMTLIGSDRLSWGMTEEEKDPLTGAVIGAAIRVRKALGRKLLESAYQIFLCHALKRDGLAFRREATFPATFEGLTVENAYRCDLIVDGSDRSVIVEVKAVDKILEVHQAQLLTYMRLSGIRTGLLINFNAYPFKSGIIRMVL